MNEHQLDIMKQTLDEQLEQFELLFSDKLKSKLNSQDILSHFSKL